MATHFSVNLNKFALLRNARGGNRPDVHAIAARCLAAGVAGVTVHPRPDQRHARYADVQTLADLVRAHGRGTELNVEGTPEPRLLALVEQVRPHQFTIVPDRPDQLTSDHGWDAVSDGTRLGPVLARLRAAGIRSSVFLDPELDQVQAVARLNPDRIELYTEPYAAAYATEGRAAVTARYREAARAAQALGLGVNAGHDLSLENLGYFLSEVPDVLEVSIGHAVICEAIDLGLEMVLARYLDITGRHHGGGAQAAGQTAARAL